MLEDFTNDTTVSSADDQNFSGVRVAVKREMCDHLLISRRT